MQATPGRSGAPRAALVSDAIRPSLERGGWATVQGVYHSVVNLDAGPGLLTVCGPASGPLPNGVMLAETVDFLAAGLRPGMAVIFSARGIHVPVAGLIIDLGAAESWSPRLRGQPGPQPRERWAERSATARIAASRAARSRPGTTDGLGGLLGPGAAISPGPVARLALPRLVRLAAALGRDGDAEVEAAATSLIGLGPGLTPSGDDALVGVAAACAALRPGGPAFLRVPAASAHSQTTSIAATFLRHAAAGEFAGRLHDLVAALLGEDPADLAPAIERALSWGATSGADTLVGVLLGLDALSGVRPVVLSRAA